MKQHTHLSKLIFSALFLALSYIMPFLTGQIPEFGSMLCPMHIPVLLCGFICGAPWGMAVGFIAPLFRSLTLGMPPLFPVAICMSFELATYGMISGVIHKKMPHKKIYIYFSLIIAMIIGRIVWGTAMFVCLSIKGGAFTLAAFFAGAITNAIPGIVLQILMVPVLVMILENTNLFFKN